MSEDTRKTIFETKRISLELIDPNPSQPKSRLKFSGPRFESLVDSMNAVGQLNSIIVIENGDRFVILAGHRRTAGAKRLEWTDIEAKVVSQSAAPWQVEALIADNTQREALTAVEESQTIQQALKLGADAETLGKSIGRTVEQIEASKAVAKAPKKIADAVKQANFDEAAAIMEFADDERITSDLMRWIGTGQFAHSLERYRDQRKRLAKITATRERLEKKGVTVIEWEVVRKPSTWSLDRLELKPKDHESCPGHAAEIEHDGTATYHCTQAHLHGKGEVPSDAPKGLSDSEKAKRKSRNEHKSASKVRVCFAAGLLKIKRDRDDSPLTNWALNYAWSNGLTTGNSYAAIGQVITALLGEEYKPSGTILTKVEHKPTSRLNGVIAMAIAAMEKRLADHSKWSGMVEALSDGYGGAKSAQAAVDYFDALTKSGYELSDCETAFVELCTAKLVTR